MFVLTPGGLHESRIMRKSSQSTEGTSAQCVEVAQLGEVIGVRDGKLPDADHLTLSVEQFRNLVRRIKGTM
ncbi:DUF397 domain-containing protein [Actinomadura sp. NPDC049382]|uniref:DUF397 domain-containing protein n=1 Tax=Actinomadura sp. NPDC049382 TaxID=3158220 RepID=UPI00342CF86A